MNYSKTPTSSIRLNFWHRGSATFVALAALGLAQPANAQEDSCPLCSKVTGWNSDPNVDPTVPGNQAETVCNVTEVDGAYVESVVYNDIVSPDPNLQFTATDRIVSAGATIAGWSFRVRTAANPDPSWTHTHLSPPPGWPVVWGDPALTSNPSLPKVVLLGNLAVSQSKFDQVKGPDGKIHGPLAGGAVNGACIARSTDGGQSFSFIDNPCLGGTNALGYDGNSMAIVQRHDAPGFSAFASFIDLDRSREAAWIMDNATGNDGFQPDNTTMGNTGSQQLPGDLGNLDTHVRLLAEGENLWKMSFGPNPVGGSCTGLSLNLNIRNRNSGAVSLGCNPVSATGNFGSDAAGTPIKVRSGPEFAFDIGLNEEASPQPEMRYIYTAHDSGGYYLQGGYCPVVNAISTDPADVLGKGCHIVAKWITQPQSSPMEFFPAIKFAKDPVSNRSGWKVTFQGRTPQNTSQLAVFAADLERPTLVPTSPTFNSSGLVVKQITPFQTPCPDVRGGGDGYWGDYDSMTFDPLTGNFVRSFTDSRLGCDMPRWQFTSHNVHVSTVELPLRPRTLNPAPNTPLAGFQFLGLQEQIKYMNTAGDICELYLTLDVPWHPTNLTKDKTGPPAAAIDSGIVAFESTYDQKQHVVYQSPESPPHIYWVAFSNASQSWSAPEDLILSARHNDQNTPAPKDGSPLAGYQTTVNENMLHVDFIDDAGYVHELWYDTNFGTYWHHEDLWIDSSPVNPLIQRVKAVNLVGYVMNSQQHVIWIGEDHNIYEYIHDTKWNLNQLTFNAPAISNSALDGYVSTFGTPSQHVNFIGLASDNKAHVIELYCNQGSTCLPSWPRSDLHSEAGATDAQLALPSSPLVGYQTSYNSQQHVFFVDVNNRVQELIYGNGFPHWTITNDQSHPSLNGLTEIAYDYLHPNNQGGAPKVASGGSHLTGYQTTWDAAKMPHVIYTTDSNEVLELFYYNNKWWWNNLSKY